MSLNKEWEHVIWKVLYIRDVIVEPVKNMSAIIHLTTFQLSSVLWRQNGNKYSFAFDIRLEIVYLILCHFESGLEDNMKKEPPHFKLHKTKGTYKIALESHCIQHYAEYNQIAPF